MNVHLKHICLLVAAALSMTAFTGCQKDDDAVAPLPDLTGVSFGYELAAFEPEQDQTRSVLSGSDIEDRISGITVTVYKDGRNIASRHFTQGFSSMTFDLVKGETYDIYALVNMGDQTSFMPADKSSQDVSGLVYGVPSYSHVNQHGLPMAGKIEGFTAGSDSPVIPVRRLFSKVTANLSVAFDGAKIKGVTVHNLNGSLCPFGSSRAAAASSIMTDVESHQGSGGTYVFYVPENMQGVIGSASAPHFKNPDSDPDIAARKSVLTYMEVEIDLSGSKDYSGDLTYRSYLGNNSTKNFDVRGNCRYVWNVVYKEDNLQHDDWKVDTGGMSDDRTLSFIVDPVYAEAGESVSFADVISTSLGWDAVAHSFTNDTKGILDSHDSQMLTVKGNAADGATLVWDIAPKANPASVGDQAVLQVVKRYIDIKEASYAVDPGKSVKAEVDYGDSGRGRIAGKGGTLWTYSSASGLSLSYSTDDFLTISVPSTYKPGKYSLSVRTSDALFSDAADIMVNDTRYIDLLAGGSPSGTVSSEGARLDVSTPVGTFTGTQNWTIPFSYGDVTGSGKMYGADVTDPASAFKVEYDGTWLSQVSLEKGRLTMKPKSGIPMGAYPVVISYKDNGFSPVTACLNITGKLVEKIALSPSPMVVWMGEPKSLTASITPSDATVKTLDWSLASGSEYASVDASGKVTGIKPGNASVVASATDGSGVKSSAVTVEVRQHVTSVTLNKTATTILVGGTETLTAVVKPDNAYDRSVTWSSTDAAVAAVDANGKITGKKAGTCKVRATSNDLATVYGECTVTVKDDVSNRIVLSPASFDLNVGSTKKITAKYYTTTNGVEDGGVDVTASAVWKTSNSSLATVSAGTVSGKAKGSVTITAEHGGVSASATVSVKDVITHRIAVTPAGGNVSVGSSLQMKAMYYTTTNGVEDGGVDITNRASWSSGNSSLASVSTTGLVSGKAAGEVKISAALDGTSGSASVFVGDVVTYRLEVSPTNLSINVGSQGSFTARYITVTNGVPDAGVDVTSQASWTSSNTTVATVNAGKVTVSASGGATIKATYNGVSGSATLTGKDVITYSLEITPSNPYVSVGASTKVTVKFYTITNGVKNSGQDVTSSVTWQVSPTGVASISGGTVTGTASGTATLKATYNGYTATASLSVGDVVTYDLVVSGDFNVDVNGTTSLSATYYKITNGVKDGGTNVTSSASWSTSNSSYATVSKGVVSGKAAGNVTITASYGSGASAVSDSHSMSVKNVYTNGLTVTPTSATVEEGETKSFKATYYSYTNGTVTAQSDVTSKASWSSSSSGVATVNSSGVATGKSAGTASIWASYNGYEDWGRLEVKEVNWTYKLVVSPSTLTIDAGETGSFTATYETYRNGVLDSSSDVTSSATWSTGSSSVATVSKGTVTGKGSGSTTVTATYSGVSGSGTVTVDEWDYELKISPSSLTLDKDETGNLTATYVTYKNGSQYTSTSVTSKASWSSSNSSGVSVSQGQVKGLAWNASATITATYSGKSATASVKVNDEPDVITYDLKIEPSSLDIEGTGSKSFTAKFYTYTNGAQSNVSTVTSSCMWSVTSGSTYVTVSGGTVTGNGVDSDGSATVKATYTYGGKSYSATGSVSYKKPADEITYALVVSPSSLSINEGSTGNLTATYYTYTNGSQTASQNVTASATWSSNNTGVAKVSKGTVTGVVPGSATITVSYSGLSDAASVTVNDVVEKELQSITFSPTSVVLDVGSTQSLSGITATYDDGSTSILTSMGLSWKSSNSAVASVSSMGKITAVAQGSATITGSYTYKGVTCSATCLVTVVNNGSSTPSIYVTGASQWIDDTSMKFGMQVNYSNASSSKVNFTYEVTSSNNPSMPIGTTGTGTTTGVGFSITTYNVTIKMTTVSSYLDASGTSKKFSVMITLPKK